jgi:hypothetical protein
MGTAGILNQLGSRQRTEGPFAAHPQPEAGDLPVQNVRTSVVLRGAALTVMGVPLASCGEGVLAPHGPIGSAELTILYNATAIMLAVAFR